MTEDRDVVIVGGGIAGLTAARELRDLHPVLLEASDRVGGRIWSRQRGDLALSVGAHMFPPPTSTVGRQVTEYGLDVLPITGSMLNVAMGGRLVRDTRPELLPVRLPLALGGRVSFARAGLRIKRDADAYMKLIERAARRHRRRRPPAWPAARRRHDVRQFPRPAPPRRRPHLHGAREPVDRRSGRDLAGSDGGAVRPRLGHRRSRPQHARRLRPAARRARPRPRRHRPHRHPRHLGRAAGRRRARSVRGPGRRRRDRRAHRHRRRAGAARARPPRRRASRPSSPTRWRSCGSARWSCSASSPTRPSRCRGTTSTRCSRPDARFNMFFNHANALNGTGAPKRGSVLMVYGGGGRARALAGKTEDEIRAAFLDDLDHLFPQVRRAHRRDVGAVVGARRPVRRRPAAGAVRPPSSRASPAASSWPATASASSSRWRPPR